MNQKQFHIISTGISLITNAQRKIKFHDELKAADNDEWKKVIDSPAEIERLIKFLKESPTTNSAEINSFYNFIGNYKHDLIEVYLFGTNTYVNELARIVLKKFLKDEGFILYEEPVFDAYMVSNDKEQFCSDLQSLVSRLINVAKRKMDQNYLVFFNPTGGLKAHVIATSVASFILNSTTYYMNEEFQSVVTLPNLIYIPGGKEIELLKTLKHENKKPLRGSEYIKLKEKYENEISVLSKYALIEKELKNEEVIGIRITDMGDYILNVIQKNN